MNNGILSKEDILCMQYSGMKASQIMNPNLAQEEFPTPPAASFAILQLFPGQAELLLAGGAIGKKLAGKSAQKSRFCARDAGATPHRARVP